MEKYYKMRLKTKPAQPSPTPIDIDSERLPVKVLSWELTERVNIESRNCLEEI